MRLVICSNHAQIETPGGCRNDGKKIYEYFWAFNNNTLIGSIFARLNFTNSKIREIFWIFNFANEQFEKFRVDLISFKKV